MKGVSVSNEMERVIGSSWWIPVGLAKFHEAIKVVLSILKFKSLSVRIRPRSEWVGVWCAPEVISGRAKESESQMGSAINEVA